MAKGDYKEKKIPKVPAELIATNIGKTVAIYQSANYEDNGENDKQYAGVLEAYFINKNGLMIQLRGFPVVISAKYEYGDRVEVNVIG